MEKDEKTDEEDEREGNYVQSSPHPRRWLSIGIHGSSRVAQTEILDWPWTPHPEPLSKRSNQQGSNTVWGSRNPLRDR